MFPHYLHVFVFVQKKHGEHDLAGGTPHRQVTRDYPGPSAETCRAGLREWQQSVCLCQEQARERKQHEKVSCYTKHFILSLGNYCILK